MSSKSFAWRAGAFVRSVLPAEPAHWLILVGSTFLFISPSLRWWSQPFDDPTVSFEWRIRAMMVGLPLRIAGMAGYYLCFVPRKKRGYFPFYLAFVFAGTSLAAMIVLGTFWLSEVTARGSIIEETVGAVTTYDGSAFRSFVGNFYFGFWLPLIGLIFLAIFFVMYRTVRSSLPICLLGRETRLDVGGNFEHDQRRTMFFAWALISLTPLTALGTLPFTVLLRTLSHQFVSSHLNLVGQAQLAWKQMCFFLFVVLVLGSDAKKTLRKSFRIPPLLYVGVSILLPAALAAIWPLLTYIYDRVHWAAFDFAMYGAPELTIYFAFPIGWRLWLLVGALIEEIAWRGFLQPRFVSRYGISRGIFLLGLVWGAFHFSGDFHSHMDAVGIAVTLASRLYMTVTLSYVLAWLTITSRSVLPAALAHGFYNILLNMPVHTPLWLMLALWAACAWILFRYFPVETVEPEVTAEPGPALEPAT